MAKGRPRRPRSVGGGRTGARPSRSGSSRSPRPGVGGTQLEGRHAVLEALLAGRRRVRRVWMAGELEPADILVRIREEAERSGVPVSLVTGEDLSERARSEAPQGVVAHADPLPEADADELLADPAAFLVALDGITDPGNLGAILRSAEAAGASGILLPKRRTVHVTPTVAKAAAGAVERLPMSLVPGIPALLERASRAGVWSVGLDEHGEVELFDLRFADQPLVLVFGAEGRGLSRLARERCDVVVAIPMAGSIASLNVAAAATLACYEVARARRPS